MYTHAYKKRGIERYICGLYIYMSMHIHICGVMVIVAFLGLLHFTQNMYLIMLGVKQGGIESHFLSFSYDLTWD